MKIKYPEHWFSVLFIPGLGMAFNMVGNAISFHRPLWWIVSFFFIGAAAGAIIGAVFVVVMSVYITLKHWLFSRLNIGRVELP